MDSEEPEATARGVRESRLQVARLEQAAPGEGSWESKAHASPILKTLTAPNVARTARTRARIAVAGEPRKRREACRGAQLQQLGVMPSGDLHSAAIALIASSAGADGARISSAGARRS